MAEVPGKLFQKSFLIIGILAAVYTMLTVKWIQDEYALKKMIPAVAQNFKSFKAYPEPFYLPQKVEFLDTTGQPVKFSKYRGQYLIVNLWASWCQPCVTELPSLKRLNETISADGKWKVIAISVDNQEKLGKVAQIIDKTDTANIAGFYDYKNMVGMKLSADKLPVTYIVSSSGRIVYEIKGKGIWHSVEVIDFLKQFEKVY